MKLNQEGVKKAARAAFDTYEAVFPLMAVGWDDLSQDTQDSWQAEIAAALTAYFDHLKQEGLMREAAGGDVCGSYWFADTELGMWEKAEFKAIIIKTEEQTNGKA